MSHHEIEAFAQSLPNVERDDNYGYSFFYVGADRTLAFVTVAQPGNTYEAVSRLDREGVYRVNIGVGKARFDALVGATEDRAWDYAALDVILPHPDYAKQHYVCILSPTGERMALTKSLIVEAHGLATERARRRAP